MKLSTLPLMMVALAWTVAPAVIGTASAQEDVEETITAIERSLWEGWKNHDGQAFHEHIVDNHVQLTFQGTIWSGKQAVIQSIEGEGCEVKGYSLSDWVVHQVGENTVLLTYRATQDGVCDGETLPEKVMASAVYVRQNGKWMSGSYHETPVRNQDDE